MKRSVLFTKIFSPLSFQPYKPVRPSLCVCSSCPSIHKSTLCYTMKINSTFDFVVGLWVETFFNIITTIYCTLWLFLQKFIDSNEPSWQIITLSSREIHLLRPIWPVVSKTIELFGEVLLNSFTAAIIHVVISHLDTVCQYVHVLLGILMNALQNIHQM